jgi:hypothetical protein
MANRDVLLLGSIALGSAEEVFRTVSEVLGGKVRRIPDGETGNARAYWIQCQNPFFLDNPQVEMVEPDPHNPGSLRPARVPANGLYSPTMAGAYRGQARLRPGISPADLRFDNFGYADWALESYATFKRLQREGVVASDVKFQVSIPTTQVIKMARILTSELAVIGPAYEAAIFREVERICASIPHNDLAIQWDCTEPSAYETIPAPAARQGMIDQMISYAEPVAGGVELGYHLCYGDWEHRHTVEPKDASILMEMANAVSAGVTRPIAWFHLPVPRDRSDDAFFVPLRNLKLHPETQLSLGLVHHTDGIEGTHKRMQAANKVVQDYAIATECGMGRRPPETIQELLRIHKQAAELGV